MLVEKHATCVLVDCGFSLRETTRRLARHAGRSPEQLSAILVTHEHGDHLRGVAALAQNYGVPVWMTPGTAAQAGAREIPHIRLFDCHADFVVDDLHVQPYPVPHDAREPCQFVFSDGARRLGLLTDVGHSTPHIERMLDHCDALILECNHDDGMLARGPYPRSVKQRIGSCYGHLSNDQAARLLARLDRSRLQHVVAAHLSDKNNTETHARAALAGVLGCTPGWVAVAGQETGLAWREIA